MLDLIITFAIASGFYKAAKTRGMSAVLWGILGAVGWFGGIFAGGMVLGATNPMAVNDFGALVMYGYGGGVVGAIIVLVFFQLAYSNKKSQLPDASDEVMDDITIEDL